MSGCGIFLGVSSVYPLKVSILYTGHNQQKNKWENKVKTMKEQLTKENERHF